ncbi:unnamed protein product [Linum tenue]|uniref:Gnk2-homologous domain-containing protein n=1 Tax=Linum tenue TaxID=586396 RepID=A0AAV0N1C3_9ROSI|nr:unnamed protein product [Linum tenue]
MASATRLLLELFIFVLIIAAAATTVKADDAASVQCRDWDVVGGDQLALAGKMKKSLIRDLFAKVPKTREEYYCNELTLDGLKMYGYGECLGRDRRGDAGRTACFECLALAGRLLIDSCGQTGAGYAFDLYGVCSFKVGYSLDVCS